MSTEDVALKIFFFSKKLTKEQLRSNKISRIFHSKLRTLSNIYDEAFRKIVSKKELFTFIQNASPSMFGRVLNTLLMMTDIAEAMVDSRFTE